MELHEKLKMFDDNKLIDIVKNYRQYRYDESIRNTAIEILGSRGIDLSTLQLTGNLTNNTYDEAAQKYKMFECCSKMAFVLYGLALGVQIALSLVTESQNVQIAMVVLFWLLFIAFITYLIKSFIHQSKYYQLVGKTESQLNPGLYFTVGVIIYAVMFFVFRKQMKDEMDTIR